MLQFAKISLVGVVHSINFRQPREGEPFYSVTVAVNQSETTDSRGYTDFFSISFFGVEALTDVNYHLRKGDTLVIRDAQVRRISNKNGSVTLFCNVRFKYQYDIVPLGAQQVLAQRRAEVDNMFNY